MTATQNLKPYKPGQSGNPNGRPKGVPNRKTILKYMLLEADIDDLGLVAKKPAWLGRVKPKSVYEAMVAAQAIKSMHGDIFAFNSLNKVLGEDEPEAQRLNPIKFINEVPRPSS